MLINTLRAAAIAFGLAASTPVLAQDAAPQLRTDATYYKIYFYKFAPGGGEVARDLMLQHVFPAMREAGLPEPWTLHPDGGEWDIISLVPLPGGYTELHYHTPPSEARWQAIAARGEKGMAFAELGATLQKLITRQESILAHCHNCTR